MADTIAAISTAPGEGGIGILGDSGNGDTTLEFLSPFLWRAPPL